MRSKVPDTPRIASCRSAVDPSRLRPKPSTPCSLQANQDLTGELRGRRRCDGKADAEPAGLVNQFKQVLPRQRIASGQNELRQRIAEIPDLLQKGHAFLEGEFLRMGVGNRLRAAMPARQSARLGHLPVNVHWRLRIVAGLMMSRTNVLETWLPAFHLGFKQFSRLLLKKKDLEAQFDGKNPDVARPLRVFAQQFPGSGPEIAKKGCPFQNKPWGTSRIRNLA